MNTESRIDQPGNAECTDLEGQVQQNLCRAAMYRLLAGALAYPRPGSLPDLALAAEQISPRVPELSGLLRDLAVAARGADLESLSAEYVRIFERDSPCSPREGSWNVQPVSGRPALLADIAGFYAAFGVRLNDGFTDTEDHVAAELEFLALLALKLGYAESTQNSEGIGVVRGAMRSFWCDHLGRFVIPFAHALEHSTREPFYRLVAQLLKQWSEAECTRLGIAPQQEGELGPRSAVEAECLVCPLSGQP